MKYLVIVLIFVISYLIGAIPNSVIIGKIFYNKNILEEGSKNAGGTNAGRVLGKKAGVIVIILDILKTLLPYLTLLFLFKFVKEFDMFFYNDKEVYNAFYKNNGLEQFVLCFSLFFTALGHCYSPYLKFKGGKAVSSYLGGALGISYLTLPLLAPIFFILLKIKKYVSLASITSSVVFCLFTWVIYIIYVTSYKINDISLYLLYFNLGMNASIFLPVSFTLQTILLIFKHHSNIKRLINGEENKIKWMK